MAKKNVAVLGAGFGGLRAAILIGKKIKYLGLENKYNVVLADRNARQTYTPLLYEVATTSKETANLSELREIAAFDIRRLVNGLPITFIQDEILKLDLMEGDIHFKNAGKLPCDFAVLALGSEVNFFGIKGAKENSLPLKTFADAVKIRDAAWTIASEKRHAAAEIIVGGGGSTGVELAGELKSWCGELGRDFPGCKLKIKIVEASPTILPGFDKRVIESATRRLRKIGVEIIAGKKIIEVGKKSVVLEDGSRLPSDATIWSGGVKTPDILAALPLDLEKGRPLAGEVMACIPQTPDLKLRASIYGIGDNICFHNPKTQKPMPGVARVALSEAKVAAHNVMEEIKRAENACYKPRFKTYTPMEYPYVIPVGGKYAIAKIGPFVASGLWGWIAKGLIELGYLLSIMAAPDALAIWLKGLKIFAQNDRLG